MINHPEVLRTNKEVPPTEGTVLYLKLTQSSLFDILTEGRGNMTKFS